MTLVTLLLTIIVLAVMAGKDSATACFGLLTNSTVPWLNVKLVAFATPPLSERERFTLTTGTCSVGLVIHPDIRTPNSKNKTIIDLITHLINCIIDSIILLMICPNVGYSVIVFALDAFNGEDNLIFSVSPLLLLT